MRHYHYRRSLINLISKLTFKGILLGKKQQFFKLLFLYNQSKVNLILDRGHDRKGRKSVSYPIHISFISDCWQKLFYSQTLSWRLSGCQRWYMKQSKEKFVFSKLGWSHKNESWNKKESWKNLFWLSNILKKSKTKNCFHFYYPKYIKITEFCISSETIHEKIKNIL